MRTTTLLDIPREEQVQMLAALRGARYGDVLALHILLLCATGRTPTEIAAWLFCSRSSVYRTVAGLGQAPWAASEAPRAPGDRVCV